MLVLVFLLLLLLLLLLLFLLLLLLLLLSSLLSLLSLLLMVMMMNNPRVFGTRAPFAFVLGPCFAPPPPPPPSGFFSGPCVLSHQTYPTLAELTGTTQGMDFVDGSSLAPVFDDPTLASIPTPAALGTFNKTLACVRACVRSLLC